MVIQSNACLDFGFAKIECNAFCPQLEKINPFRQPHYGDSGKNLFNFVFERAFDAPIGDEIERVTTLDDCGERGCIASTGRVFSRRSENENGMSTRPMHKRGKGNEYGDRHELTDLKFATH